MQHSTKTPDTGLRPRLIDTKDQPTSPSVTVKAVTQTTPSKANVTVSNAVSSPGFDFKWSRPEADLSTEAQKIMESVREEAARIKAKMQEQRDQQARDDGHSEEMYGVNSGVSGRKMAKPKSKAGRFSNAHVQEFKKMDSIVGNVAAWKNKFQERSTSLKRTKSKAELDAPEPTKSKVGRTGTSGRLENPSPGKRSRQKYQDDVSALRPVSRDGSSVKNARFPVMGTSQLRSGLPSAVTTPTKSSLARAASVKQSKTSLIPSLNRSKSTIGLVGPGAPKTEGSNKYHSALNRIGSMKSILHRPAPKFTVDPAKQTAGTYNPHTARGSSTVVDKDLPSLPGTPSKTLVRSSTVKRQNFTPRVSPSQSKDSGKEMPPPAPTPSKIPQASTGKSTITYPSPNKVTYPTLPTARTIPAGGMTSPPPNPLSSNPTQPGDFTFRTHRTINFGPATSGLTSPPNAQHRTIRQVRPSGIATPLEIEIEMPLGTLDNTKANANQQKLLPATAHGISNKKRARQSSPSDDDIENEDFHDAEGREEGSPAKKLKTCSSTGMGMPTEIGKGSHLPSPSPIKSSMVPDNGSVTRIKPAGPRSQLRTKTKTKGTLMSRLNQLARPKERR